MVSLNLKVTLYVRLKYVKDRDIASLIKCSDLFSFSWLLSEVGYLPLVRNIAPGARPSNTTQWLRSERGESGSRCS